MAERTAKKIRLELPEVLEKLFEDSSEEESLEISEEISESQVISTVCSKLSALKSVDKKISFMNEAPEIIKALVLKHSNEGSPISRVLQGTISLGEVLKEETQMWLKMLKRRITRRMGIRNPWHVQFTRNLPVAIFSGFQKAVTSGYSQFGLITEGNFESHLLHVEFTEKARFVRDFKEISGISLADMEVYLKKRFSNMWRAEVIMNTKKTCSIVYNKKKQELTFGCYYGVWNQFGFAFHDG